MHHRWLVAEVRHGERRDRVIVDGRRVGHARRAGVVTAVSGTLVTVRWDDGHVTTFAATAGTMTESHDLPKGIGAPATRALVAARYTSIDHLAGADVAKLAALHGVGPKALRIIAETLAERGAALLKKT